MKTFKTNKIAIIRNSHTAEGMLEIEEEFIKKKPLKCTLEELIKSESAKKAKV